MKNPTMAAIIIARPAKAKVRGPPKIPMKNATAPNAASSEPTRPAVFDIPVELLMLQK
jgi:hypothetical protein